MIVERKPSLCSNILCYSNKKNGIIRKKYSSLTEDEKRLYQCNLTKKGNHSLNQTEQKLQKDEVTTEKEANKTHYKVGRKIRKTIEELGGILPENLPTPKKSLKQLEKENQKNSRNQLDR